jgi:hypothetical protein
MWKNPHWIDEFLSDSDSVALPDEERRIVTDWRNHFVYDKFIVVKQLPKYAVFMDEKETHLFGVYGLTDSIEYSIPGNLPFVLETILIPFKDKIIYDSLFRYFPIKFGPGARSSFNKGYKEIKQEKGIIERLTGDIDASTPERKQKR